MKNTTIDLGVVRKIAIALGDINERAVYVGGSVVSLYADDPAADDVRPTKDIDISLEIVTFAELEELRQQLAAKGFHPSFEDNVACRFRYEGEILLDVMSTRSVGWAPANPWFAPGFKHLETRDIDGQQIQVLPFPYFLATKFAAFNSRGKSDARASKDFEDIVFLLDNRVALVDEILASANDVKEYLTEQFEHILRDSNLQEALRAHLFYETQVARYNMIMDKLNAVCNPA